MTEETPPLTREQIVADNIIMREQEVMHYQINIYNYQTMLDTPYEPTGDTDLDAEMLAYRDQIAELLKFEKREQAKSKMVLAALQAQLEALQGQQE